MFSKSALIVSVVLALQAFASPIDRQAQGTVVPFAGRSGLTGKDGMFDHGMVIRDIVRTQKCVLSRDSSCAVLIIMHRSKHRRNMANVQMNAPQYMNEVSPSG